MVKGINDTGKLLRESPTLTNSVPKSKEEKTVGDVLGSLGYHERMRDQ
jgi:hypothetical protein